MSKFDGFFKDWVISDYEAVHRDGRKLWVANGFLFLKSESHRKTTLIGFSLIDRYKLWRELKREVRKRNIPTSTNERKG